MNWRHVNAYVGTHVGAVVCLVSVGFEWNEQNVLGVMVGAVGAVLCWVSWKWIEEVKL